MATESAAGRTAELTPSTSAAGQAAAASLRGLCGGAVLLPGDPSYDEARMPWNVQVDVHPAAVVYPAFPDEVAEVLRAAADAGLAVATQGTGHGVAPLEGRLDGAVLLRTSAMTGTSLDVERATARVGAGVLWGDVIDSAGRVGLAARHASSPDVGVVGTTLGGGISWYGRRHGLQSSALTAVELVLADGTHVRADDGHEPELLWAARGGGGGFAVVTAMEFDLLPVPTVYGGMLVWDWRHAERVLSAWVTWSQEVPEEVTSAFRLVQAPDQPELPEGVRGRQHDVLDGAVLGDPERAARLLAPLRGLRPEIDTFAEVPAASLGRLHLEPEGPTAGYATNILLAEVPDAAVEALLSVAGPGSGSSLTIAELRQLGGALGRPAERSSAMDRVEGAFLAVGIGVDPDPASWARQRADAARMMHALRPWATGQLYAAMNDDRAGATSGWPADTVSRLATVRAAADPGGLFVHPYLGRG
ncbi:MAG: putative oxidoreductase [Frankiales bacterium]|nr:putative oxidoreductase [Frankiales bacterium]